MAAVIEIEGLRKEYRRGRGPRVAAVAGIDLEVPEGGVFGFLGPNGSGKTTTIRCLLGLAHPTSGRCRVLGADSWGELWKVRDRVGALVESPGLTPDLTARQNLALLGRLQGIGTQRVTWALERAGLAERADDAVRGFSLGMRQRLGIAIALLRDPEVVVLDEPANGLDPAGIREVRELTRSLGAEGRTVFVSSHLLAEVQHTCDRVAILSRGRCIKTGRVADVVSAGHRQAVLVCLADLAAGRAALAEAGIGAEVDGDRLRVDVAPQEAERVTRELAQRGLYLTELRAEEIDLETVFFELTGEGGGS